VFQQDALFHHGRRSIKHIDDGTRHIWSGNRNRDRYQSQHDRVFNDRNATLCALFLQHDAPQAQKSFLKLSRGSNQQSGGHCIRLNLQRGAKKSASTGFAGLTLQILEISKATLNEAILRRGQATEN
jgi:hypothetical protein